MAAPFRIADTKLPELRHANDAGSYRNHDDGVSKTIYRCTGCKTDVDRISKVEDERRPPK